MSQPTARERIANLWDRSTPIEPLLDAYRAEVIRAASDDLWKGVRTFGISQEARSAVSAWLLRIAAEAEASGRAASRPSGDR